MTRSAEFPHPDIRRYQVSMSMRNVLQFQFYDAVSPASILFFLTPDSIFL